MLPEKTDLIEGRQQLNWYPETLFYLHCFSADNRLQSSKGSKSFEEREIICFSAWFLFLMSNQYLVKVWIITFLTPLLPSAATFLPGRPSPEWCCHSIPDPGLGVGMLCLCPLIYWYLAPPPLLLCTIVTYLKHAAPFCCNHCSSPPVEQGTLWWQSGARARQDQTVVAKINNIAKDRFHCEILASLNFNKNKMLSPGLENNCTLKCCFGNFPTYLYMSRLLEK